LVLCKLNQYKIFEESFSKLVWFYFLFLIKRILNRELIPEGNKEKKGKGK